MGRRAKSKIKEYRIDWSRCETLEEVTNLLNKLGIVVSVEEALEDSAYSDVVDYLVEDNDDLELV